jgi:hypothetical protein
LRPEVGERAEPARLGSPHGEYLAKLEVRHCHRERGAAGRRVLHTRQSDVEIAALDGLVDRLVGHLHEQRRSSEALCERLGDLHVEAAHVRGIRRVRLDERRAALRVAAPAQRAAGPGHERRDGDDDREHSGVSGGPDGGTFQRGANPPVCESCS